MDEKFDMYNAFAFAKLLGEDVVLYVSVPQQ